ncbi:hypothetical protein K466DRAFT_588846 [Polyporus arcularius HHB13444]|uniref:Uncharacterized protein n=1 Tax=Polyporus arcularius HHB13444 TaxID=1314778 RepID=A0A5C3PF63_9APHY|nr:hypothetical protein K466DRAFT_588846 [Polyporus arcularius HHB13444]
MAEALSELIRPHPPLEWLPEGKHTLTLDPNLPRVPTPPIPEELRNHGRILYGIKVTNAHITRYLEENRIHNLPEDALSRRMYKFALIQSIADELEMGFITQFHKTWPGRRLHDGPDEDMIFWASGSYGRTRYPNVPSPEIVKVFLGKLGIHDVEAAWCG